MARKDISDILVLKSYIEYKKNNFIKWPYQILMEWTGYPQKVCYAAMERAHKKGLIEYGSSLRTGWLTEKGKELLKSAIEQPQDNP